MRRSGTVLLAASLLYLSPAPGRTQETNLPADKEQPPIYFQSENLEYREAEQLILASGNVTVQQTSYTFRSTNAIFDIPHQNLSAWGNVRFTDVTGNVLRSKSMSYSAETGSAKLDAAEGAFGPFLFSTQRAERDALGNYFLYKTRLSTCESDLSKYHLYGHRIKIVPNRRLTVSHAIFRLGPVPILYLPYYYYSLGEKHLAFQIFPGQNQSEGFFVRTIWGYPITDDTYLRVYLDALTNRGFGHGGEFNYYAPRIKGSVYGYRIDDKITNEERWNARFFHWQELRDDLILQANANRLSDDAFPNDFFREDFDRVVRDPRSQAALTFQKKSLIARVSSEREDLFDPNERSFFAREIIAPRLELNELQGPLGFLGLEKTASVSFLNRFGGVSQQTGVLQRAYRRESDAQFTLLRKFSIYPGATLLPRASVRNTWIDRPQGEEPSEPFVQRGQLQTTLRQRVSYFLDIDLTHRILQRFQDNQGEDQGREAHLLSFLSQYSPNSWFSFRFNTDHYLPRLKGEPLAFLERRNYTPLQGEVSLWPKRGVELFFREQYQLSDPYTESAHPLSTQSEIVFGERELGQDYFSMNTSYIASRDDAFEMSHSGRISPFRRLQFEGTLRTLVFYTHQNIFHVRTADFFEKELKMRTSWRCWDIAFVFRERKGVLEFVFNLELQLDRTNREEAARKTKEAEWYPWRGW